MKKTSMLRTMAFGLMCSFLIISCDSKDGTKETSKEKDTSNTTTENKPADNPPADNSATDGQFLVKAAESDMTEIKASETAKANSSNKDVKDLAKMMIEEHNKMSKGTADLAAKKSVTLPGDVPADKKAMLDKAAALKGSDFDKEYISQLKAGHNEAIAMLEKASTEAKDADIKAWATDALPKVKMHLQMIVDTESKLNK